MKYKLESVGVDTTGYDSIFPPLDTEVVMIDISSGNDYILEPTLPTDSKLVVKCDKSNKPMNILYHLNTINRKSVDIVLTDELNEEYLCLQENGYISELGLIQPSDVDDKKTFLKKLIENKVSWVLIDLDPLNFDYDLIKYCEESGIKIMGTVSENYLPDTFNLSFYSRYCNIVFLPITDNFTEKQQYLHYLIGTESPKEVEITKTTKKRGKLNIGVSLKINEDLIIPCPNPRTIMDPEEAVFSFGDFIEKVPEKVEEDELVSSVINLWENIKRPDKDDISLSRSDLLNELRYRVTTLIDHPYNIGKISEFAVVFVVRYGKHDMRNYIMFITKNLNLFFSKLENTSENE